MARRKTPVRLPDSSDSSDDDASVPQRAPLKAKLKAKALQLNDDTSANTTDERTARARKPTDKQDKNGTSAAKKAVEKSQRQTNKAPKPTANDDDEYESEEKDDVDDEDGVVFSSSSSTYGGPSPFDPNAQGPQKSARSDPRLLLGSPRKSEFHTPLNDNMDLDRASSPVGEQHENPLLNDHDRGRSLHSATPGTSRKRPSEHPASSPPPEKRTRKVPRREPHFAETYVVVTGARPKAADYEPVVRAPPPQGDGGVLHAYPDHQRVPHITTQLDWAKKCFKNACRADNVRFSMTERIVKLITKRGSWIRGQIITQCRALFCGALPNSNRSSMSRQAITANRDLSEALKTGAHYHYKDSINGTGYGENKILLDIRKAALYPFVLLALEFAALGLCNSEWSTGKHEQSTFSEKQVGRDYLTHLADIKDWAKINPEVVDKLRRKWYTRTSSHLTGSSATANLAGRTGDTNSEAEQQDMGEGP
ncbi:hypothetical protein B0H14DRAFT_3437043 [Mycena olivaceomarginata]|nr:hypothetical protein B0H14DRAFT_3437043 [Mycena olivaceomarginata]